MPNSQWILPNGEPFAMWECETSFTRTYYVSQRHPHASDDNPGTKEAPFLTIGRAAELLLPGERVVIEEGVYRETVKPARGGRDSASMISYEAAEGHQVTISGTEIWQTDWQPLRHYKCFEKRPDDSAKPQIWQGRLPVVTFSGTNPFSMVNMTSLPWVYEKEGSALSRFPEKTPTREYLMRRGLLFVDGRLLEQVVTPTELFLKPGTYWVEDSGLAVSFRLEDNGDPRDHVLSYTAREQLFVPEQPCSHYIRLRGLHFEGAGNGFPAPQRGAVSVNAGHHWIVEHCMISKANGIGLDLGGISNHHEFDSPTGYHLIRRNTITDCGVCGIAGVPASGSHYGTLLEGNRLERNCWHHVEQAWESGAIKLHLANSCLVKHNMIIDTRYGPAIWLDYLNDNSRVTGNAVVGVKATMYGAIFVEATHKPNRIDGNLIWDVGKHSQDHTEAEGGGHGIYEHDSDALLIDNNIVANVEGYAMYLNYGNASRIVNGRGPLGRLHRVIGNLMTGCQGAILFPTPHNEADGNLYGDCGSIPAFKIQRPDETYNWQDWRQYCGWDLHGDRTELHLALDLAERKLHIQAGLEGRHASITLDQEFGNTSFINAIYLQIDR